MNGYMFYHKLLDKISILTKNNMVLKIKNQHLKEKNFKLKLQQWHLINFLLLNGWDEEFINDILNGTFYHKEVK